MAFRIFIERGKHDGQDGFDVVADEIAEVFVVPEIECSLGHLSLVVSAEIKSHRCRRGGSSGSGGESRAHLKVWTGDRFGQLIEERLLDLGKLCRVHDLKNVLDFIQKHDFLCAVDLGPIPQQTENDLRTG